MHKHLLAAFLAALSLFAIHARADVTLPKVFGDHMVLQREMPLPIWGWADAGEDVKVQIDTAAPVAAQADAKGNWKVVLPAMPADGKAHFLTVTGKNKIELDDVLIGEVWIGSGQSNMEFNLSNSTTAKEAIAAANLPQIRLLHVQKVQSSKPEKDFVPYIAGKPIKSPADAPPAKGSAWKVCSPQTVPAFAAVLFYFGQRLHKELNVPIGLINSSWGGSPIEQWIPGQKSGGMYNAMIAPLQPFAMRGALWYQGEANVNNKGTPTYADKMKSLIEGWRQSWGPDLSFYFVQIAPWQGKYEPGQLPKLWECQAAALKLPRTGMAVVTDLVDNIKDIHPKNKIDVGNRLALWALAKNYGKPVVYSGPMFKEIKVEGSKIRVSFAHVGAGLKSRDEKPLREFEIAGQDGKFVPADATIDGQSVLVQARDVASPAQVRFGWNNIANPNLCNADNLPAAPFQSNNWQGGAGE